MKNSQKSLVLCALVIMICLVYLIFFFQDLWWRKTATYLCRQYYFADFFHKRAGGGGNPPFQKIRNSSLIHLNTSTIFSLLGWNFSGIILWTFFLANKFSAQCTMVPLSTRICLKSNQLRPILKIVNFDMRFPKIFVSTCSDLLQPWEILVFVIFKL